jgi:integrase
MEEEEGSLLEAIEGNPKLSASSKATYRKLVTKMFRALRAANLQEVTVENVKNYVERGYAGNTKRLVAIVFNSHVLKKLGLGCMPVPRKDRRAHTKRNHFNREELNLLLDQSRKADDNDQLYHCIRIGATTGMRIKEILDLTCKDVIDGCLKNPVQITVRCGKGGKSRDITVCGSECGYFQTELLNYARGLGADDKIFNTKYDNMLYKLKTAMTRVCMDDQLHRGFHGFRSHYCTKTFAAFKENNFTYAEQVMQRLMGHSNPKTTRGYMRPGLDEQRNYAMRT